MIAARVVEEGVRAIGRFTSEAVRLASQFEQTSVSFKTLIGDAESAKSVLGELEKFSISTPFEADTVIQAGQTLLAFGVQAEKVGDTIRFLGEASAATGADLGNLAFVFGQVRAQGRAYTQDLNQFVNAGIPILEILGDELGVSAGQARALAAEGKITFEVLERGFRNAGAEGGRFFGALIEQSRTASGISSTLRSSASQTTRTIGQALLPVLKEAGLIANEILTSVASLFSEMRDSEAPARFAAGLRATFEVGKALFQFLTNGMQRFSLQVTNTWVGIQKTINEGIVSLANTFPSIFGQFGRSASFALIGINERLDELDFKLRKNRVEWINLKKEFDQPLGEFFSGEFEEALERILKVTESLTRETKELNDEQGEMIDNSKDLIKFFNELSATIEGEVTEDIKNLSGELVDLAKLLLSFDFFPEEQKTAAEKLVQSFEDTSNKIGIGIANLFIGIANEIVKASEEATKKQKEDQEIAIRDAVQSLETLGDISLEQAQRENEARIKLQQERIEQARRVAERGNAEQLQLEEERLSQLLEKREEFARRERAIDALQVISAQSVTAAESAKAVAKAFASPGGFVQGLATSISLAAALGSIILTVRNAFSGIDSFDKGTENLFADKANDSALILAHKGERILTKGQNAKIPGSVKNEDVPSLINFALKTQAGQIDPAYIAASSGRDTELLKGLTDRLDALIDVTYSKDMSVNIGDRLISGALLRHQSMLNKQRQLLR